MWRTITTVARQRRWHLGDAEMVHLGLNHHFQSELHPATLQTKGLDGAFSKTTQAAIEVAAFLAGEKEAAKGSQKWITEISVHGRHCSGGNAAAIAISHHQIVSGAQFLEE